LPPVGTELGEEPKAEMGSLGAGRKNRPACNLPAANNRAKQEPLGTAALGAFPTLQNLEPCAGSGKRFCPIDRQMVEIWE